jgi:cation diffusion facilitator CzcD-associated flavoprotein CzcO
MSQAVIGAGAAGLVTARELRKEGHDVVVFEQQEQLGGTWLYTDQVWLLQLHSLHTCTQKRLVHASSML